MMNRKQLGELQDGYYTYKNTSTKKTYIAELLILFIRKLDEVPLPND